MTVIVGNLRHDRVASEVIGALNAAGIPVRLLKGPVVARWLYQTPGERSYRDVDLLLPAEAERLAWGILGHLGFTPDPGTGELDPGVADQHIWWRGEDRVELHTSLVGVGVAAESAWETLVVGAGHIDIGERRVQTLGEAARLLHLALHAAQHGREASQPLEDLRRGLAAGDQTAWAEAATLAQRLDAGPAFAAGLDLVPEGARIRRQLGLSEPSDVSVLLRAGSAPPLALGIERLVTEPGWRLRARRVVRAIFPTPAFMRWWTPIARRGPLGMGIAYAVRPFWVLWHLVPSFVAWKRARARAGVGGP